MNGTFDLTNLVNDPSEVTPAFYETFLNKTFGPAAPQVAKTAPLSAFNSTPFPAFYALAQVITDQNYKCPAFRGLNRAVAKGVPAWTYFFNHTSTCIWIPCTNP